MPNNTPAAKAAADQYITIPVAEYIYLHKQATMLEIIMRDSTYNHETVAAAKALYAAMNDLGDTCAPVHIDLGEAGADQ